MAGSCAPEALHVLVGTRVSPANGRTDTWETTTPSSAESSWCPPHRVVAELAITNGAVTDLALTSRVVRRRRR